MWPIKKKRIITDEFTAIPFVTIPTAVGRISDRLEVKASVVPDIELKIFEIQK